MHSCIYAGTVHHRRVLQHEHQFRYSLFMLYLDLDELGSALQPYWFWSANRPALARFRRADHLGDRRQPLAESVRALVAERLKVRPDGPVRLLTNLRYFGFLMNPVSFYFCYDTSANLLAIVAEVTNTPWKEQHCYVIDARRPSRSITKGAVISECSKEFHVSPFMPMEMSYRWQISQPAEQLNVEISNIMRGEHAFQATLHLQRQELCSRNLTVALLKYPALSMKIGCAIYWQALKLWWKRTTFFPHPQKVLSRQMPGHG